MGRSLIMEDHRVKYLESGLPLWFILVQEIDQYRLEIIIVGGETEKKVRKSVEGKGTILKVVQLWTLLDRARIMAGFMRDLG